MKLIAIDDGHGMETAGKRTPFLPGTKQFMHENEFNNATAQYLKENLERSGFRTLMVAPGDADTPLRTRTDTANNAKADFYISVHANALTGVWGAQNGVDTFHYPGSVEGKRAAEIINKYLAQGTVLKNRGVHEENFHVLRETHMPAVLVEAGFMDNLKEAKLLMSDAYRRECAEEIAKGICEYFGVAYVPDKPTAQELVEFAHGKLLEDEAYWIKKALTEKPIYQLLLNFKNLEEGRK
jgi:N-acetylmuramoyl-L-alanine amidase